jgi:hypothetical protein
MCLTDLSKVAIYIKHARGCLLIACLQLRHTEGEASHPSGSSGGNARNL